MKTISLICAVLLFLALIKLPIGYYTILRIVVTIGAVAIVAKEFKDGINIWVIVFGFIAVIFNPILPVYLHDKAIWMPIDLICGSIFTIKYFVNIKKL
jgi:hypothetical protein